jgi:acid stress-induced BolA-like protein IbaG/YrbA
MAAERLKTKVYDALKAGYFKDSADLVDVSDGADGNIHVVVVSRKFDGRGMKEKHDLIWDELEKQLTKKEWGQVSLAVGVSPEEVKAT